ncbi:gluzincin family metallopeptidase [Cytobacillus massiliigabonensis]|uniref:hypothetical protein n=1 Tax=Cytobacillus massiliigabonensis TaxID=1871011 RepID=UPI000C8630CA|nr:hypothetical protein [Cytobacillus massiliigabonensis]
MLRYMTIIFSILLITACSNSTVIDTEKKKEKTVQDNIVISEDGKISFKIYNTAGVPEERVDIIKKEISNAYKVIHQFIKTDYTPSEKINIFLLEGNENSWGLRSEIKLYSVRNGKYPLVHEMTHTLLGYGNNFDDSKGYLTQEGLGVYMENTYGKQSYPVHKVMNYLMDKEKIIPINKLIDLTTDDFFFRPPFVEYEDVVLQWISYTHAGSFITFLIDSYGLEKFEQVYNQDQLEKKMQDIYGKQLEKIEEEWLHFIEKNEQELTSNDMMKIDHFYNMNSVIDHINVDEYQSH